jgi:ribosomal-protein-alanine N-acetyltransferase
MTLAFERLGMDRVTAWANTRNGRSQVALERVGFRREGELAAWHRHGDQLHDVVVFGLTRPMWERSALRDVQVEIEGSPPPAFLVA